MKKLLYSMILLLLVISVNHTVFAEETLSVLDKAEIRIDTEDDHYVVNEQIELIDIYGDTVEIGHTLSKITDNQVSEVHFYSEDKEVLPVVETGELMDRYILKLSSSEQGTAAYTINYMVPRTDSHFDVPLFVPDISTEDGKREVLISFKAPEGMEIQKNSFPNIVEGGKNHVEKHMTNIPSKAAYVFSKETIYLHSYNVVSFIAIFSLVILLISWGMVEIRKSKRRDS